MIDDVILGVIALGEREGSASPLAPEDDGKGVNEWIWR